MTAAHTAVATSSSGGVAAPGGVTIADLQAQVERLTAALKATTSERDALKQQLPIVSTHPMATRSRSPSAPHVPVMVATGGATAASLGGVGGAAPAGAASTGPVGGPGSAPLDPMAAAAAAAAAQFARKQAEKSISGQQQGGATNGSSSVQSGSIGAAAAAPGGGIAAVVAQPRSQVFTRSTFSGVTSQQPAAHDPFASIAPAGASGVAQAPLPLPQLPQQAFWPHVLQQPQQGSELFPEATPIVPAAVSGVSSSNVSFSHPAPVPGSSTFAVSSSSPAACGPSLLAGPMGVVPTVPLGSFGQQHPPPPQHHLQQQAPQHHFDHALRPPAANHALAAAHSSGSFFSARHRGGHLAP